MNAQKFLLLRTDIDRALAPSLFSSIEAGQRYLVSSLRLPSANPLAQLAYPRSLLGLVV